MPEVGKTGGFDAAKAEPYIASIESLNRDIESLRGKFMSECKAIQEDIKDVLDDAKAAGCTKKAIRKVVQVRALERKIDRERDSLEGDDQEQFDLIRLKLGDLDGTPLGQAALGLAPDDKDVRPDFLKRRQDELAAEAEKKKAGDAKAASVKAAADRAEKKPAKPKASAKKAAPPSIGTAAPSHTSA